ncbi:MAG: acyl-CoA dehydrogenase family protein [bacterium]|nr:acyl-CoA dehydrogenase family protein [bacterium]
MYTDYYKEHKVFIESVRRFIASNIAPRITEWEKAGNFPDEVFQMLGKQGFLGILIPEEYGGIEGDYKMAGAWCEVFGELASVGLTIGVNMHSLVISSAVAKYGSKECKEKWLPPAMLGEKIGAYAFTEPGAGSDLASLRTKAVKDGDSWILNGSKTFITNGARAHFILVLARTDLSAGYKGFTTFLVDTTSPGFKVEKKLDKLGWRASDTAELSLENVRVSASCIMGKLGEGWIQASNNLNWERMMLTLTSLAGARAVFKDARKYASQRMAFGKSIDQLPAISSMLSEMYRKIVRCEAMSHAALDLICEGKPCRVEVSLAKKLVCDDAIWIADRALQIHGGYGYTTEFSPERWWRDLRLMPIGGGTSEIMANIAMKDLDII